jgi:hypothetical protein
MEEITHWMNIMFMKINPEKTEIMLFHPKGLQFRVVVRGTFVGEHSRAFDSLNM